MGKLAPKPATTAIIKTILKRHSCDRCGISHDGIPIAHARYEIVTPKGSIFLCGHHYKSHSLAVLAAGYGVMNHGSEN